MQRSQQRIFKTLILLGESFVGKSSLIARLKKKEFQTEYIETLGANYHSYKMNHQNEKLIFELWETCPEEISKKLIDMSVYKRADCFVIVCSYDVYESFQNLNKYLNFVSQMDKKKICVVVNKSDLKDNDKLFTFREIEGVLSRFNYQNSFLIETSAKEATNVVKCFLKCVDKYEESINELNSSLDRNLNSSRSSFKLKKRAKSSTQHRNKNCC